MPGQNGTSITKCGPIYILWGLEGDIEKQLGATVCALIAQDPAKAPESEMTSALVLGKQYWVAAQEGGDWGSIRPQEVANALPQSSLMTVLDIKKKYCP